MCSGALRSHIIWSGGLCLPLVNYTGHSNTVLYKQLLGYSVSHIHYYLKIHKSIILLDCTQRLVTVACSSYLSSDWPSACAEQRWLRPAGQGWWQGWSSQLVGLHVLLSSWREQCCQHRWGWSYWLELKYQYSEWRLWSEACLLVSSHGFEWQKNWHLWWIVDMIYSPGLAIGLSPKPIPWTEWSLVKGVDWMAPKPGWIEGVLTTVGWRGVANTGGMTGMGRGSGCRSSSSSSKWTGWGSRDWDREDVELTSSKSS